MSRILPIAAVASFVLYAAGMIAIGTPPPATAAGVDVIAWLRSNENGIRAFVWTAAAGTPVLSLIVALLRHKLPAPHRDVFLLGGAALIVTSAVQSWFYGGLTLHAEQLEPQTARAILDVAVFWGPVLTGSTITMMAPVTLLAMQQQSGLPRWLGWLGIAVIAEQAIETVTIFGRTGFIEPGGAMNMQLGAGMFLVWLFAFVFCASRANGLTKEA